MRVLRTKDLLRVGTRLMLLHVTWCEGRQQSVGLAYGLAPALARIHPEPEQFNEALRRFDLPFSTHPFLVSAIAGAVLHLEEAGRSGDEITRFVRSTMGPLAAIGDPFFRASVPALAAALGSLATLVCGPFAGIAVLVIAFTMIQLAVSAHGVFSGYREGYQVLTRIGRWIGPSRSKVVQIASALAAGVVLVVAAVTFGAHLPLLARIVVVAAPFLGAFVLIALRTTRAHFMPVILAVILLIEVLL